MSFLKRFKQQDRLILHLGEKSPKSTDKTSFAQTWPWPPIIYNIYIHLSVKPVGTLPTYIQQDWCLMSLCSSEAGSQPTWHSISLTSWLLALGWVLFLLLKTVSAAELMCPWMGELPFCCPEGSVLGEMFLVRFSTLSSLHQEEHTILIRACFLVGGVGLLKIVVQPGRVLSLFWAETR